MQKASSTYVQMIETETGFTRAINTTIQNKKATIIDCFATWCGPCMQISPAFEKLSTKYTSGAFYKLNVDNQGLAPILKILETKSIPAFYIFVASELKDSYVGNDIVQLEGLISKYCS